MLKGERIALRALEFGDLPRRVSWVNTPEIRATLMFDYPLSLAKTEKWFRDSLMDDSKKHFSIMHPDSSEPIGMTGLLQLSHKHQRAQFYITIGERDFWGKGIANEVIQLVLEYGFVELNLNKIFLYTIENNQKARKIYEKNGFVAEGVQRQHYFCVGEFQNLHQHAILRSDWLERRNGE